MTVLQEKLSIIHTKGSIDWAYSTFILASTAAAMGKEVEVFFSFYGVKSLYRDTSVLKLSPLENSSMILKPSFGPEWFQSLDLNQRLPRFVWMFPGMIHLVTLLFKHQMKKQNQLTVHELRSLCIELGVKFTVCSITFDLLGINEADLIEEYEVAGAATYFATSAASQSLFV